MRFLVDASMSATVARGLREAGHDAVHVGDVLPLDATDELVLSRAAGDDRVLVSADTDFGDLLAQHATSHPSLILFRRRTQRRPVDQIALLLMHLADIEQALLEGAVVVIEEARIRVRPLPIGGDAGA